jgi:hypothetical protein
MGLKAIGTLVKGKPYTKPATFSEIRYLQDGIRIDPRRERNLRGAKPEELAKTDEGIELMQKMQTVKADLAKAGKKMEGSLVLLLSNDGWLNVRLYRTAKQSDEDVVGEIASLPL